MIFRMDARISSIVGSSSRFGSLMKFVSVGSNPGQDCRDPAPTLSY
jgi:hypothetical protein